MNDPMHHKEQAAKITLAGVKDALVCSYCQNKGTIGKRGCPLCHRKQTRAESECERRLRGAYEEHDYLLDPITDQYVLHDAPNRRQRRYQSAVLRRKSPVN